jgi:hypothetical protein
MHFLHHSATQTQDKFFQVWGFDAFSPADIGFGESASRQLCFYQATPGIFNLGKFGHAWPR